MKKGSLEGVFDIGLELEHGIKFNTKIFDYRSHSDVLTIDSGTYIADFGKLIWIIKENRTAFFPSLSHLNKAFVSLLW